jgi:hypothetical protein
MVSRVRPDRPEDGLTRVLERIDRTETTASLRSASVHDGRTRFVGLHSLVVEGSALVDGVLDVLGRIRVFGLGILEVLSLIDLLGSMRVRDGGSIDIGQIKIADGKIVVGGGDSPATIENGKVSFGTGGTVEADVAVGGVKMTAGDSVVNAGTVASIRKGESSIIVGPDQITINPAGDGDIDMTGGTVLLNRSAIPEVSGLGLPPDVLLITSAGRLRRTDGT